MNKGVKNIDFHDKYVLIELDNGLRVVFNKLKNTHNVFCGVMIAAGSRFEDNSNNGIAHLIEHLSFKKTKKRSTRQIFNVLESVGGDMNAYTTREKVCFYTTSEKKYLDRSLDFLNDITFNVDVTEENLNKEKKVILEEIEMYKDNPEECIYDEFHSLSYPMDSIGKPILGTLKSLKNISVKDVESYKRNMFCPSNMVLSIAGNISLNRVLNRVLKYFNGVSNYNCEQHTELSPSRFHKVSERKNMKFQQLHCIIGNKSYSYHDLKKYPLLLMNMVLAGDFMSSRLNMSLREKHAFVYSIYSNNNLYAKEGLYSIQFGSDDTYFDKSLGLIEREFKTITNKKISINQLNRAKRQLQGQYSMYNDNGSLIMQSNAKNLIDYGKIISREEFFERINKVTVDDILEVANEILVDYNILVYNGN